MRSSSPALVRSAGTGGAQAPLRAALTGLVGLVAGVAIWQIVGQRDPVLFATPGRSLDAVNATISDGSLPSALRASGTVFGLGLVAAAAVGFGYGLLVARSPALRSSTEWLVYAMQSVPIVALAPLILSTLGFGLLAKSIVVFLTAVFPILINTAEGARRAPATLLDVAHVYRSSEWRLWHDVLIPHTVPYAMTGLRQGIAMALVGTLVAEFFLNASGIGGLLLTASANFDSATVLGLTLVVSALAVTLMALGRLLERRIAPWREQNKS